MCVQDARLQHASTLWWALISYFRTYPPLVHGHGAHVTARGGAGLGQGAPEARPAEEAARKIRIYW